jgi:hypothetical protein
MNLTRDYIHRTYGEIGTVTLIVPDDGWILNGHPLSPVTVEHLAFFALQTLQDAYSASKTHAEAVAMWSKKLDKLLAGMINPRTSFEAQCRIEAVQKWREAATKKDRKTFSRLSIVEQDALLAPIIAEHREEIEALARIELDTKTVLAKARAEAVAALSPVVDEVITAK